MPFGEAFRPANSQGWLRTLLIATKGTIHANELLQPSALLLLADDNFRAHYFTPR
jgi:hypothetical protein